MNRAWVYKRCTFDAAHQLPDYPGNCARVHGHTYIVELGILTTVEPVKGYGVDMKDISNFLNMNVKGRFDHHFINEKMDVPTTAENIALEIARVAAEHFKTQVTVRVYETPDSWVVIHDAPRVKNLHPMEVS